ncbi:P-type conjugative transfer ATPase TrbB [Mitsuokella sp. oral taxon 131]|uniref:P-type conjugative transfer ATPase TrbB n=1 Tax=Mitsuokella sp. oral taxon 131 TaxID=1321780 RepID=UPI0003AE2E10|nr:P-type conjugative transfer ATPase TrbB [Mitsuokella sp. oral taxon 131]ERL03189.1 P-type conjugative transfer ATPase TrbB [Mitsuokella sp. oral taxon 131 str. W9106]
MAEFDQEVKERRIKILEKSMGPDIMHYMHDDNVTEVIVNPDGKLWVDTFDKGFQYTGVIMDSEETKRVIYAVADLSGQVIDLKEDPSLQADIPASRLFSNCRFQAELPMIVAAPSFNIRKHSKTVFTLADYVRQGTMTEKQRQIILDAIHGKKNIIAAGGTASGKTTLLNAILAEISNLDERIITIEDTKELKCTAENYVALSTTDTVDMENLLRKTLRLSPNRIVVGEVRGKEALTLIDAWSTGHRGGCSTVHSDSAQDTLFRLEDLVSRVSLSTQQAGIARAIDVVVYIARKAVSRKIEEIVAVDGWDREKGDYMTRRLDID